MLTPPKTIPIFPLSDVLLIPKGEIPLTIFEPRYLQMVSDCLKTEHRLIGLICPATEATASSYNGLEKVGIAGKLMSFIDTDEDRYFITLTGYMRFTIDEEISVDTPYRQIAPKWIAKDLIQPSIPEALDRKELLTLLQKYFSLLDLEASFEDLEGLSDENLLLTIARLCPITSVSKQQLLLAENTQKRAKLLTHYIKEIIQKSPKTLGAASPIIH